MALRPRKSINNSDKIPREVQNATTKQILLCSHAPDTHYLGKLNHICSHCGSLSFMNELFRCCHNGKVHLESLYPYPDELKRLLMDRDTKSLNFQQTIRSYNSAIAFASMGANLTLPPGCGPSCFRICGQIFHRSGTLHPSVGMTPVFN